MEFKSNQASFGSKKQFANDMKRFICDEAARFTTDSNEAASASVDEFVEKTARFSSEKNKRNIKEKKQILSEIKAKKEELLSNGIQSIHPSKQKKISSVSHSDSFDSPKGKETKEMKAKELKETKKTIKKEKAKEIKKAGAKTAVASMFKAKKDMSNDLVGEKVTGNALKDGLSGLMQTFVEFINPMRVVKGWMAKLAALLAPYIAIFMMVATVVLIIVMFVYSILKPIADIGNAISNFLSIFSVESDTFTNVALTEDEINEIVEASECDETQESVIRYALSKVGYPYSQEQRTSGSAYDCSSLAYYCWKDAGVDISYGSNYPPTAAEGARMLNNDGKALDMMDLKAGDLIFYGGDSNGRYMGIYHVAIYVGNGKAVEALNTKYGVVYQTLRTKNAIMVCRPNK
ncbi:MAG: NlpC/P60 family protein [bacterium]|nr:NlpC/P60 family protein [bacterium]